MEEYPVKVYIYDISRGMARAMSQALIGKQLDGIWHTGIVVYGQEFFFGGMGIESCAPGGTVLGQPNTVFSLPNTQIPFEVFMDYLQELATTTFRPECYHLFEHNCNNFSAEVAQFLTGQSIPSYITNLPQEVLNTPFGAMIKPMVDAMSVQPGGGHQLFPTNQSSLPSAGTSQTQQNAASTSNAIKSTPSSGGKESSRSDQPFVYDDKEVLRKYIDSKSSAASILSSDDKKLLEEIHEYVIAEQPNWSLGRTHILLIGKLLHDTAITKNLRNAILALLQLALLREDVQCLLVFDTDNKFVKFFNAFDSFDSETLLEAVKMCVNCCSTDPGIDWATSCKEWAVDSQVTSNCKIISKFCANALLSDNSVLQTSGAALAYNLTRVKIQDEAAVEVGSAILQLLTCDISDKTAYHCLRSLHRSMTINREVVDVALVLGLDLSKYRDKSSKLHSVCTQIKELLEH